MYSPMKTFGSSSFNTIQASIQTLRGKAVEPELFLDGEMQYGGMTKTEFCKGVSEGTIVMGASFGRNFWYYNTFLPTMRQFVVDLEFYDKHILPIKYDGKYFTYKRNL